MKTKTVSALLMSATANLGTTKNLAIGVSDIDRLKNPSRTPFLLDEIRFLITVLNRPAGPWMLWARFDLGRLALTGGRFIPLPLLGVPLDPGAELFTFSQGQTPPIVNASNAFLTHMMTWKLPRPLYVPAGECVVPQFLCNGEGLNFDSDAMLVDIAYAGRALPADATIPQTVDVPFVTSWIDTPRTGGTDFLAVRSQRSDLKNPFAEPLFVQRMLGTYMRSATPTQNSGAGGGFGGGANLDDIAHDLVTARIVKSDGKIVAKDATPWAVLFPLMTRSLTMCSVLKRNEFYLLSSDIKLSSIASTRKFQLMASIIGYRKVAYARGSGFVEAV